MPAKPVLLFDLGGVLVDVAPADHMLASLGLTAEPSIVTRWAMIDAWIMFETGELDAAKFAALFAAEFSLDLDPASILLEFEAWNRRMFPGAVELLAELRMNYRLAVLSNTNEVHWRRLSGEFVIPELVDYAFASHLIGLRKPDARAYQHVAAEIGVRPADLVFFDDNQANVDGALALGIQAWRVQGVTALKERLTSLGYLPA
jgi:putative hydrolase of the HAD superfamily